MKRHRLVVPVRSDEEAPEEFDISQVFEPGAEKDAWTRSLAAEEPSKEFDIKLALGLETDAEVDAWTRSLPAEQPEVTVTLPPQPAAVSRSRMMMVLMEHPFFALSDRRSTPIDYTSKDGSLHVRVEGGVDGMATIQDADIVMFLIDRLADSPMSEGVSMSVRDYLRAVDGKTGGDQYRLFARAVQRLQTTRVTTNAMPNGKPGQEVSFCWIEVAERIGRNWHITVPAWLTEGARSKYLLGISPGYFELRGLSRALYLVARKHVGSQDGAFRIRTSTLHAKLGSASPLPRFRHDIKKFVAEGALPDFALAWEDGRDGMVTMKRRV